MTAPSTAPASTFDVDVLAPEGLSHGVRATLRRALPLLVGIGLLMAGNGLTATLLGVRASLEGFPPAVTGLVLAGYYLGFLGGSLATPPTIRRVGHVRVFAGLASLASATVLVHVVRPDPLSWFALRSVSGLCLSGLYVVTETWLNGAATNTTRGTLLATYMVVVTGGLGAGQVLFSVADPGGFAAFVLASVLVSLAVVPVSLASVHPPEVPDPQPLSLRQLAAAAPLAPVGAALSGLTAAAMIGAGAIYAAEAGFNRGTTATFLAAVLVGGLALQVPLGRLSDRIDRRRVIGLSMVVAVTASLAAAAVGPDRMVPLVALTLLAGGASYPLYSLSNAHLNDYLSSDLVVASGAGMVMVNGAGSVLGPIAGGVAVATGGPGALFMVLAGAYAATAVFAAWRITRRAPVPEEERATYSPVPVGASPTVATLAEGAGEELYPASEGVAEVEGFALAYRERGIGPAVVLLVHDPAETPDVWDEVLTALAADGLRAVAPRLRRGDTPVETHVEDLLALLLELELPAVTLAGHRGGVEVVAQLAQNHVDRVEAVAMVGAEPEEELPESRPVLRFDVDVLAEDPVLLADLIADFLRSEVPSPR